MYAARVPRTADADEEPTLLPTINAALKTG